MDKNTVRGLAIRDGINTRTAQLARARAKVGERVGRYWLLTEKEWGYVKKNNMRATTYEKNDEK